VIETLSLNGATDDAVAGLGVTAALPLAWSDVLILSPCPLLAATVALVAARMTALARLRKRH
jgi:cell division transport system permease protein